MSYVLIIGAKSDIAKKIARVYARHGYHLYLTGRNVDSLQEFANDIKIRNDVDVQLKTLDVTIFDSHQDFYQSLSPKPEGVIVVSGYMAEQAICENDFSETLNTINVNYIGAVSLLNIFANNFEQRKQGFIVGISSVAGDRGRKTNYIYGSAKAGFTAYLSGLRNRLHQSNVKVLTVKPGFVNTQMTKDLDLPKKLTAEPSTIAKAIYSAQQKGKNTLYSKRVWWLIMLIIKLIPESIFKRMSI